MNYTNRSRFIVRVAACITGDNPWAMGWEEYRGTYRSLMARWDRIKRDHGGNIHTAWFHKGAHIPEPWDAIQSEAPHAD